MNNLSCTDLTMRFGGVLSLDRVSFHLGEGETVGIIGPNGSGKSTLVNCLTGFYAPTDGDVSIRGERMSNASPIAYRRRGVVRTFQNLRLFGDLTVLDNAMLGLHLSLAKGKAMHWSWIAEALRMRGATARDRSARAVAMGMLERVGLDDLSAARVDELSYGTKKRLEIARAAVGSFSSLLLDEPTAGLLPHEASELVEVARAVRGDQEGASLLLIEHRLDLVLEVCDRVVIMDGGRVVAEGRPSEIVNDKEVLRAYMGDEVG